MPIEYELRREPFSSLESFATEQLIGFFAFRRDSSIFFLTFFEKQSKRSLSLLVQRQACIRGCSRYREHAVRTSAGNPEQLVCVVVGDEKAPGKLIISV